MVHDEVPTRLLNVTEYLLVALYFTTEEEAYRDEDGFVYCLHVGRDGLYCTT